MNDTEGLLEYMKGHADWMLIEQGDGYTADIIQQGIDEIKRLRTALEDINGLTMSMFRNTTDLAEAQREIAFNALKGKNTDA